MGKLRRFEIDAIIEEIRDAAKIKNEELLVGFNEETVDAAFKEKYPDVYEFYKEEERINELQLAQNEKRKLLKSKYSSDNNIVNGYYTVSYYNIRDNVKKELQSELGFITVDPLKIERKIILHGQTDLQECLNVIKEELGL